MIHAPATNSRRNAERIFFVAQQGWYLRAREGLLGPFKDKDKAQQELDKIVNSNEKLAY